MKKNHWDNVYQKNDYQKVSWFQDKPEKILDFIEQINIAKDSSILDVGAGTSLLVDNLIEKGFNNITLLDLSEKALDITKERVKEKSQDIQFLNEDICHIEFNRTFKLWHDRAVFHFLTDKEERELYLKQLNKYLLKNGFFIFSGFSLTGPDKCSGLKVMKYSHETIQELLGASFKLLDYKNEVHITPSYKEQHFLYCLFKKVSN